jgi:hypothetical protein
LNYVASLPSRIVPTDEFIYACITSSLFLLGSSYLLSDIKNNCNKLTITQIMGFVGIYCNGTLYLCAGLLYLLRLLCYEILSIIEFGYSTYWVKKEHSVLSCCMTLFCLMVSIGFLQYSLSSTNHQSFKYVYISLPLWFSQIFNFLWIWKHGKESGYSEYIDLFFCIASLTFFMVMGTLIGLYFDGNSHNHHNGISSLGYAFLPLLIYQMILLIGIGFAYMIVLN